MTRKLASEKVVVSAPLSFSGSAQRIWKITNVENPIAKAFTVLALYAIIVKPRGAGARKRLMVFAVMRDYLKNSKLSRD